MASAETRTRLLESAHALFAEQGYAATSLREITAVAEANLAAVNYHFGSKEGLLLAVLHRTIDPINEERLRGIEEAEARHGDRPVPLDEVLRIFLGPVVRQFQTDCEAGRACLISRLHHEPEGMVATTVSEVIRPVVARFVGAIQRSLPHLSAQEVMMRGTFMFGAMIYTLGGGADKVMQMAGDGWVRPTAEELLDSLVRFGAAGMSHDA